jgi:hypothetical protein
LWEVGFLKHLGGGLSLLFAKVARLSAVIVSVQDSWFEGENTSGRDVTYHSS